MPAETQSPLPHHRRSSRLGGGRSRFRRGAGRLGRRAAGSARGGAGRAAGRRGPAHAGELAAPLRCGHRAAQPGRRAGRRTRTPWPPTRRCATRRSWRPSGWRMAASALSLNRPVYEALRPSIWTARKPGDHGTTSSARCSATGWPAWTRTRPRATACRPCTRRLRGSRSSSAATSRRARKTIEATPDELDGLPADYLARHPAGRRGPRHAHHRPARYAAGDDLCLERRAARAHVPGLQHPRLPGQPADSSGLAGHAAGDRRRCSASAVGPTWPPPTR